MLAVRVAFVLAVVAAGRWQATAQEAPATSQADETGAGPAAKWEQAPAMRPDLTPRTVSAPAAPAATTRAATGALADVRALSIRDGEARLATQTGERVVKPGDALGGDTVKAITSGRLVLLRAGGEAVVIVTLDAQGRPRERVYAATDPTARVPPEVK